MPIYEYRRPDGTTFEVIQGFSDEPLTHDPDTGVPVDRVLHAPAVHFKGKGFYNTDYGTRKRQRETASASEKPGSTDGSASSTASEKGATDSAGGSSSDAGPASPTKSGAAAKGDAPAKGDAAAKAQSAVPAGSAG